MSAFHFELVSPEKLLFSGEVESVVVPGLDGDFEVMKDHAPLMSTLKPGITVVHENPAKSMRLFVRGGFAEVNAKGLTILAEQALPIEELDAARIAQEISNAEEDVADAKSEEAKRDASEKLEQLKELKAVLSI
ncbi:MAG: F0F1 ATP synthase subunit epsilon [Hyphomicrobiales bacterium]|nr:F0F1 ATP synthase subunit epsilon [Hyphomicrobiales bacterium]